LRTAPLNLEKSVKDWVLLNLPYDKSDRALCSYINAFDAHGLLVAFRNWESRLIRPTPRTVHISNALNRSQFRARHQNAFNKIVSDIENGNDLNRYLSERIRTPIQLRQKGNNFGGRKDLDLMLIDWGMHHLHLGSSLRKNGFVSRSSDLLFAIFKKSDAYLIDIKQHNSFTSKCLIKTTKDEFLQTNILHEINGIVGLSEVYSEVEHLQMRNVGINIAHEIDGQFYMTLGGISAASTSVQVTSEVDRLMEAIENFEARWYQHEGDIRAQYQLSGFVLPQTPDFSFGIQNGFGPSIFEATTKCFFPLLTNLKDT
jgi:hypothetical protein